MWCVVTYLKRADAQMAEQPKKKREFKLDGRIHLNHFNWIACSAVRLTVCTLYIVYNNVIFKCSNTFMNCVRIIRLLWNNFCLFVGRHKFQYMYFLLQSLFDFSCRFFLLCSFAPFFQDEKLFPPTHRIREKLIENKKRQKIIFFLHPSLMETGKT